MQESCVVTGCSRETFLKVIKEKFICIGSSAACLICCHNLQMELISDETKSVL